MADDDKWITIDQEIENTKAQLSCTDEEAHRLVRKFMTERPDGWRLGTETNFPSWFYPTLTFLIGIALVIIAGVVFG